VKPVVSSKKKKKTIKFIEIMQDTMKGMIKEVIRISRLSVHLSVLVLEAGYQVIRIRLRNSIEVFLFT